MHRMRIKTGDTVQVIAGKDRGATGAVKQALPAAGQVIVEGVNLRKRHRRGQVRGQKGEIVEIASPIDVSNVQVVDPKTNQPTRVGIQRRDDGTPVRVAKKSGTQIDA